MSVRVCCRRVIWYNSRCHQRFRSAAPEEYEHGETHFGYQTVTEEEKEEKVYSVFHNVAEKYDVMNDVMSGGVHRLWKDHFMRRLAPLPGTQLIDVAGGTGDIAFRFLKYAHGRTSRKDTFDYVPQTGAETNIYEEQNDQVSVRSDTQEKKQTHVTVCDINQAMLDVGKKRAANAGMNPSEMSWLKGNAECLPVAGDLYDAYTIAYGIRNVTHIDKVLSEAYRVLKPGGRFMCLEFSDVPNPLIKKIYDEYSFQVIPVMGKLIAGDWHSYQYLVESIRQFPNQENFATMIREAGFKAVSYENLMMGVSAIHSGFKL